MQLHPDQTQTLRRRGSHHRIRFDDQNGVKKTRLQTQAIGFCLQLFPILKINNQTCTVGQFLLGCTEITVRCVSQFAGISDVTFQQAILNIFFLNQSESAQQQNGRHQDTANRQ
ncbi:Uncharacterised protein [Klebsiella pneumoniae]|uniref:hypothetical protein n=1 Tax=Klebsiella variicola TaxID=244366 RepID=UPI0009C8388B|nr:Uncharacterised protein [Klebsiella pneumoniae]